MNERVKTELALPELEIYLKEEFGSKSPDYRMKIRQSILSLFPDEPQVLDLNQVPKLKTHQVSISHTQRVGGFALNPGSLALGFDIELTARIKDSHLERLSHYENEAKLAPGPHFLWTAKEAAFKAMADLLSIRVISDLSITNWTKLGDDLWRYDADAFYGVSFVEDQFTLSLARAR